MLTPLDIENKRFTKTLKGYNVDEVDDFLDQLTLEYEKLYKENAEFKQKFEDLEKELAHYKEVEQSLQKTLMIAQSTAENVKSVAQQQADQIIRDAQAQAKESLSGVTKEEFEIRKKTEDLRRNFDVYKAKMEALLISQLELLQDDKNDDE
jgi:cell division initiation protein